MDMKITIDKETKELIQEMNSNLREANRLLAINAEIGAKLFKKGLGAS